MGKLLGAITIGLALVATDAAAQVNGVNLNGPWQCVAHCVGHWGGIGFITQNGWELNIVNPAGQSSRGWVDHPGHIWLEPAHTGAMYSPRGRAIQFDSGAIWLRPWHRHWHH